MREKIFFFKRTSKHMLSASNLTELNVSNLSEQSDSLDIFNTNDPERRLRALEDDIKSVASFALTPEELNSQSIDAKLKASVSSREYEKITRQARRTAMKSYRAFLSPDLAVLLNNHHNVLLEFGTENDDKNNNWEIDKDNASTEEIQRAILRLQKKIARVNNENDSLKKENDKNLEKLRQINEQNEKLEEMKNEQICI